MTATSSTHSRLLALPTSLTITNSDERRQSLKYDSKLYTFTQRMLVVLFSPSMEFRLDAIRQETDIDDRLVRDCDPNDALLIFDGEERIAVGDWKPYFPRWWSFLLSRCGYFHRGGTKFNASFVQKSSPDHTRLRLFCRRFLSLATKSSSAATSRPTPTGQRLVAPFWAIPTMDRVLRWRIDSFDVWFESAMGDVCSEHEISDYEANYPMPCYKLTASAPTNGVPKGVPELVSTLDEMILAECGRSQDIPDMMKVLNEMSLG